MTDTVNMESYEQIEKSVPFIDYESTESDENVIVEPPKKRGRPRKHKKEFKKVYILTIKDNHDNVLMTKEYNKILHISKDLNIQKNLLYRIYHGTYSYSKRKDKIKWSRYSIVKELREC